MTPLSAIALGLYYIGAVAAVVVVVALIRAADRYSSRRIAVSVENAARLADERAPFMLAALREVDAFLPLSHPIAPSPGTRLCWCCPDNVVPRPGEVLP